MRRPDRPAAARPLSWLRGLSADLRFAARGLRREPGFALAAVASLALAIGANTAIFGLLDAVLLRRLPVPDAEQLVAVAREATGGTDVVLRFDDFVTLRDASPLPLHGVGQVDNIAVERDDAREYTSMDFVTGGYFGMLGVRPLLGRLIGPGDDRDGAPVVVLSERVWELLFARDPAAVGGRITLGGQPFTVVGVLPASFRGVRFNGRFDLAIPQRALALVPRPASRAYVSALARLEGAPARARAAAALDAAYRACCLRPDDDGHTHLRLADVSHGVPFSKTDFRADYARVLALLMGGVLLVLLVACSNVGNLLLARGATRRRELSVRLAIGAGRARIVRQLLVESALLTALGAAAGLLLAAWGTAALVAALPAGFESTGAMLHFRVSPSMLAFTTAVCALCVVACGLGPALRATRGDLASWLAERAGSRGGSRHAGALARVLVVAQVALTLLLVTGATLCVATLRNLRAVDPGFASDHLVMVNVETRGTALERAGIVPIHRDILERAARVPGVRAVGMATRVPSYGGRTVTVDVRVPGLPGAPREIELTAMTPGYLRTAGTRLLAGRDVATSDVATSEHVAVVNEAFARELLGGASPLGRTVHLDGPDSGTVTVVGVAQDVRFGDRRTRQDPMLYVPVTQAGDWPFLVLAVRTRGEPHQAAAALQDAVRAAAPLARASRWQTMDEAFDEVLLRERLVASLGAGFAALALALAMVGLAGVVGYGVARRVREIGVRMALGAHRTGIVWLVLRESLSMVALGVALAAPLTLAVGRAMGALLFGVAPADPRVLLGAALALLTAGAAASALPAWRAARVHPASSLRAD